jgi:hypothetical protein
MLVLNVELSRCNHYFRFESQHMKQNDIAKARLKSQQLSGTTLTTIPALVGWMGAIQAQDYAMSKWAIGVRLPGATDRSVEQAFNDGTILRTHVLRPTWHLVSASDIHWMLELTAPKIRSAMKTRHQQLELTPPLLGKCRDIFERVLEGQHLTREELIAELGNKKIPVNGEQAAHIMELAELDGLVCSGALKGIKQTYALLAERSPRKASISKDEALAKLATIYFTGHAPATLADFTWWSGLPAGEAKRALELIARELESAVIDDQTYWFPESLAGFRSRKTSVHLLPAFDEFLISYKNRTASISMEHQPKAFTNNGIFRPTVVISGQTTGVWKRTVKKDRVVIEANAFLQHDPEIEPLLEKAKQAYATFLGKDVEC